MANGTIKNNFSHHSPPYALLVEWSSTSDVATNSSVVVATIKLYVPYSLYIGARSNQVITINGVNYTYNSPQVQTGSAGTFTLGTITTGAIPHNADGTKSVSITCNFNVQATISGVYYGNQVASGTATLDNIPRKATITSAPNFTDDDDPIIHYLNSAGSAASLRVCISSDGVKDDIFAYQATSSTATAFSFTLTSREKEFIRNATIAAGSVSIPVYFIIETTLGGVKDTYKVQKTCSIASPNPVMTLTAQDINETTLYLTGDPNKIIKGHSNVEYFLDAYGVKEAEVVSRFVSAGTYSATGATGIIERIEANTITYAARDNRNVRVEKKHQLDMIDYFPVSCSQSSSIKMSGETTAKATVKIEGTFFNQSFGAFNNQLHFYIDYGNGFTEITTTPSISGNKYELTYTSPNVPYNEDFVFVVRVEDELTFATTKEYTLQVIPVFDWSKTDFNFNVPVKFNEIQMNDFVVEQGTKTTGSGNSQANWVYRKWNSGVAECWCRKHVSTAVNTTWGNLYVSGALSYTNLPWGVSFTDIPVANITIAPNNSGAFLIAGGNTSLTATNTGGYEIARGSALASASNFYINYYAIGKWK